MARFARAARHRDRQRGQPRPADRVARTRARRGRRRAPARRARPARRRAAAARAHDRHAQARPAGAARRRRATPRRLLAEALAHRRARRRPSCASWRTGSCPRSSPAAGCAPASTRSCRGSTFPVEVDVSSERLPRGHRGQRVLHRRRGAHERRQARPGDAGRGERPRVDDGVLDARGARRRSRRRGSRGPRPRRLADRVDALGGRLRIESSGGTTLTARLPLPIR